MRDAAVTRAKARVDHRVKMAAKRARRSKPSASTEPRSAYSSNNDRETARRKEKVERYATAWGGRYTLLANNEKDSDNAPGR